MKIQSRASLTFFLASLASNLLTTSPGHAQAIPQCVADGTLANQAAFAGQYAGTGGCYKTPDGYSITINEMGLCTADPWTGSSFNESTCTATFSGPQTVDLAGSASFNLSGANTRPPNGTYTHAYIKISNTIGITGSYQTTAATHTTTGATTQTINTNNTLNVGVGAATESAVMLNSFGAGCIKEASATIAAGTISAYTTTSNYNLSSTCQDSSTITGIFVPLAPFIIDDECSGMLVSFRVSNTGMQIIPSAAGGGIIAKMVPGVFQPVLSLVK